MSLEEKLSFFDKVRSSKVFRYTALSLSALSLNLLVSCAPINKTYERKAEPKKEAPILFTSNKDTPDLTKSVMVEGVKVVTAFFNYDIYSINPDGTNLRRLTFTLDESERGLTLSPSGDKIAYFTLSRLDETESKAHAYMSNSDGSDRKEITEEPLLYRSYKFAWSPDGTKLTFAGLKIGESWLHDNIFVYDINKKKTKKINKVKGSYYLEGWSHDGRYLYYEDDHGLSFDWKGDYLYDTKTGKERALRLPEYRPDTSFMTLEMTLELRLDIMNNANQIYFTLIKVKNNFKDRSIIIGSGARKHLFTFPKEETDLLRIRKHWNSADIELSPNKKEIAFLYDNKIYVFNIENKTRRLIYELKSDNEYVKIDGINWSYTPKPIRTTQVLEKERPQLP